MEANEIRRKLGFKSVGIAGLGGLGSNCAVALARVGVGRLVIADFDAVERSNLNRQYYFADQVGMQKTDALKENIRRIDASISVESFDVALDQVNIPLIFEGCDVIVEAFDKAEMKQMIIETVLGTMPHMPIVCGIGVAGWGESRSIQIRQKGLLFICGDGETEASEEHPPLAPRVGIVSNMQANEVLEILLGKM
jgi:sulfur carrier protein ThiS adenylyltransferase